MDRVHGQADFAAALFDPAAMPIGLTTSRGETDELRFAVYRNNVNVALIKAIEGRYPVMRRIVGDGFFRSMAHAFIAKQKPKSPLIFKYGDEFPDFIAGFCASDSLSYLPDVARLEAAWTRAYHAAEAPALTVHDLALLNPEGLPALRLVPHPSASIIACEFAAGAIWAANQLVEVPPVDTNIGETILIVRPFAEVFVRILPAQDTAFAQCLVEGSTLGDAGQEALSRNPNFDFGTALIGLVSLGAFSAKKSGG